MPGREQRRIAGGISGTVETKPYDDLRRARHGELRHRDLGGLRSLHAEYFAHADEFETVGGEELTEFTFSQAFSQSDAPGECESVTRILKATVRATRAA